MFDPPIPGRMPSLSERWRPTTLSDVVGQWDAVNRLRTFGNAWSSHLGRPSVIAAVLEGPTGSGKTSAAHALAHDMGWNIVEMNASDARNEDALSEIAGRASITDSFTDDGRYLSASSGGRSLVLMDEVDALPLGSGRKGRSSVARPEVSFREFLQGRYRRIEELNRQWQLSGKSAYDAFDEIPKEPSPAGLARYPRSAGMDISDWLGSRKKASGLGDEGAIEELSRIVKTSRQPLILTATDAYAVLRASTIPKTSLTRIRFLPVDGNTVQTHLKEVATREGLTVPPRTFDLIAQRSNGDLRAALNDLEAFSALPPTYDASEVLTSREVERSLFEATRKLLSTGRFVPSAEIQRLADVPPDELLPWMEENIPGFAEDEEGLLTAQVSLARADLFLFRANRWRIWSLWSYASELMSGGASVGIFHAGRPGPNYRPPAIDFPQTFRSGNRETRWVREALARKLGDFAHMSRRRAASEMIPFVERLFRTVGSTEDSEMRTFTEFQHRLAQNLDLDPPELSYFLRGLRPSTTPRDSEHLD